MKIKIQFINKVVALMGILLMAGCGNKEPEVPAKHQDQERQTIDLTEAQYKSSDIKFGKVELKNLSSVIQCNGVLEVPPQNLVSISIPIGGFLKSTEMLQGIKVKKGEVIAVFEHPDYIQLQQEYIQAKANLEFSEMEYKRQEELNKENVNSEKTYQKTKADYLTLKAQVSGLQKKLEQIGISISQLDKGNLSNSIVITSPINGYVTKVNVNIGKYVAPNDIAFEIVDTEHLHATLTVYEKDITKIKVGQAIRFTLPNETDERTATVHLIGKEISKERTVRVHGHLDKEDPELLPGMYIKAIIEIGDKKTPSLPEKAIVQYGGKNYIFVKASTKDTGHTFKIVEVKTGVNENGYVEVILPSGIDSNSEVVINGAYDLLTKMFNKSDEE